VCSTENVGHLFFCSCFRDALQIFDVFPEKAVDRHTILNRTIRKRCECFFSGLRNIFFQAPPFMRGRVSTVIKVLCYKSEGPWLVSLEFFI